MRGADDTSSTNHKCKWVNITGCSPVPGSKFEVKFIDVETSGVNLLMLTAAKTSLQF